MFPKKIAVMLAIIACAVLNAASATIVCNNSPTVVEPGGQVDYTITVIGQAHQRLEKISLILPQGFNYLAGSTSGTTNSDPSINNQILVWDGIRKFLSSDRVLNFSATASTIDGEYTVEAEIIHTVFVISGSVTISLGPTAPVTVETPPLPQPFLVLTKMVDKTYAVSGAYLNYTLLYLNSGNGDATEVKVFESIPPDTHYISGSAIADGMNIQFSPDGGLNYYNQETTPITDLKFELGSSLPTGQGGSIIFKVEVK